MVDYVNHESESTPHIVIYDGHQPWVIFIDTSKISGWQVVNDYTVKINIDLTLHHPEYLKEIDKIINTSR